jgi:hypothetical protein
VWDVNRLPLRHAHCFAAQKNTPSEAALLPPLCKHSLIFDGELSPHFLGQWFEFDMYAAINRHVPHVADDAALRRGSTAPFRPTITT